MEKFSHVNVSHSEREKGDVQILLKGIQYSWNTRSK